MPCNYDHLEPTKCESERLRKESLIKSGLAKLSAEEKLALGLKVNEVHG